ncbi:SseB family protein [Kribbia dieselivorans]|uniref:SseB family protein n=1 Tax=Kribbia dieselivorans TaxID=331526 RepID=UPI000839518D|nr:SseB family protein [Kribbia dieselivorans]
MSDHSGHDHSGHDHGFGDSAGIAWTGRQVTSTGFDNDLGQADPALIALLAERRAGDADDVALMRAVEKARFVVPIVAAPAEVDDSGELTVEKQTDMAAVTLTAPDGQRALPVFTGIEVLASWDAAARPVPVTASRAAQAAVSEQCHVMVLDVGSDHATELRPSMVWALAQQRDWVPAHADDQVADAVAQAVAGHPEITGHVLAEGKPAGQGILQVVLELTPGLDAEQVQALVTAVAEQVATDGEVRARIDGLAFALR